MRAVDVPIHLTSSNDAAELVYGMDDDAVTRSLGEQVDHLVSKWSYDAVDPRLLAAACPKLRKWEIFATSLVVTDVAALGRYRALLSGVCEIKVRPQKYLTMEAIDRLVSYMPHLRRLHLMPPDKPPKSLDVGAEDFSNFRALRLEALVLEGVSHKSSLLPLYHSHDTLRALTIRFTSSDATPVRAALAELFQTSPFPRVSRLSLVLNYCRDEERDIAISAISACPNLRFFEILGTVDRAARLQALLDACPRGVRELVLPASSYQDNVEAELSKVVFYLAGGAFPALRRLKLCDRWAFQRLDALALQMFCRTRRIRLELARR
ncbi:hypothetical protein AURDEDRAFT_170368 [Auricularia subglabra TFB-10046 SS5]|nr:hypothetical protein AURDEDRAFT_170368 [Auricularia subglabra TFB-10046 SS5]